MLFFDEGDEHSSFDEERLKKILHKTMAKLSAKKEIGKVLILPPDFTRFHSRAGEITATLYAIFGNKVKAVLPTLGTHCPMSEAEKKKMFAGLPLSLIKDHDYQNDVVELGRIKAEEVSRISEGAVEYDWPAQVNKLLVEEEWDLIVSVGQVVPHEVAGMAGYAKNLFVGTGGKECIDKSHYIGARANMERIMGRPDNPVRELLNLGADRFLNHLPILHILTVVAPDMKGGDELKGLFIGDDSACYKKAARLAQKTNIFLLAREPDKVVVLLDKQEYKSAWVGNKGIYRTRLAIADGGELILLAPGVRAFGENPVNDRIIRQFGYRGSLAVNELIKRQKELAANLGAASHLIHGSPEGRFKVTYCPGHLTREEIEGVGYRFGEPGWHSLRYDPSVLTDGWNRVDGEDVFFISNPGLGLWVSEKRFFSSA